MASLAKKNEVSTVPKITYIDKRFRAPSLALIEQVEAIVERYEEQGYSLTLRQVYYQLVAADVIPNSEKSYNNLGTLLSDARLAGMIDWYSIDDRSRTRYAFRHYDSPDEALRETARRYRIDLWEDQPYYIEVWVEKDALSDVVGQAASKYDVSYFACRGYVSQSAMWQAAQRFIRKRKDAHSCLLIYLGDHDPSGLDMSRDITERLELFGADVTLRRIALNFDQVKRYSPPPNPAKVTDSRAEGYIRRFGHSSWELDALPPQVIDKLITDEIRNYLDTVRYLRACDRQEEERKSIA